MSVLAFALATQAAPWSTVQDTQLYFPAADLSAGVPLQISAIAPQSAHGGRVSLVSTQAWIARYDAIGTRDLPWAIVVDGAGNAVVAGQSLGDGTGQDFMIVKYSANGSLLWTNRYTSPEEGFWGDVARVMGIDREGNVFVSGSSGVGDSATDLVTLKYASNGLPLWTNRFSVSPINQLSPSALTVDRSGNVAVLALDTASTSTFENWIVVYNAFGVPLWTNYYQGSVPNGYYASALATDSAGNVIVGGSMFMRLALAKYAPDGSLGSAIGYNIWSAPLDIFVDSSDNIVVAGPMPRPAGRHNSLTAKFSSDGTLIWTNVLQGPAYSGGNVPRAAVDQAGNVFTTGASAEVRVGDADYTTVKLNSSGVPLWTNRFTYNIGGRANFVGTAADRAGNCYIFFSASKLGQSNRLDYVLLKLGPDGARVCTHRFDSGNDNSAHGLGLDSVGNVFVTGMSDYDFLTVKYSDYVLYSPPRGFIGTDSFAFTTIDFLGNTSTGMVSVTVLPVSLRFTSHLALTSSGFHMQLEGTHATNGTIIYASTDLIRWKRIFANPENITEFTDPDAGQFSQRFYIAVSRSNQ